MKTSLTFRRSSAAWGLLVLGLALLAVLPLVAPAEGTEDDKQFMIAKGRVTYRVYCINCHGAKAEGDGSLAEMLSVQPANLTTLTSRAGDGFPSERVYEIIDGREGIRGHGMKEMPVWGDVFQTSSFEPAGSKAEGQARAKRKIWEVVFYLESIQPVAAAEATGD